MKKKIKYQDLLKKIDSLLLNKSKENEEFQNTKEIIDLDINRTYFETDVEEKRKVKNNKLIFN